MQIIQQQYIQNSHLLSLLFDEEHELEPEECDSLVVGALTCQLLVVRSEVAGLSLYHLDPRHPGEAASHAQPGEEKEAEYVHVEWAVGSSVLSDRLLLTVDSRVCLCSAMCVRP